MVVEFSKCQGYILSTFESISTGRNSTLIFSISNKELIENEKKIGYSSKEFFIDDLGAEEWLINITYLGNKKPEPTFFKVTIYTNWGSPDQSENIHVFNFEKERDKFQLFKLSNQ